MGEECYALSSMIMNIQFDRNSLFLVYTERICYAYIALDPWSRINIMHSLTIPGKTQERISMTI